MTARSINTDTDHGGVARILALPDAASAQEPATLAQLNAAVEGLAWKDSARVSTQGNINLASPGTTIDAVTMAASDRVLVRSQTSTLENGLYIWNGAAVPMTRSLDANTAPELEQAVTTVEEGTDAGSSFRQQSVNFVLGTDPVVWVSFGTVVPAASETTAGKLKLATQTQTDTGTDDTTAVTPLKLANSANRKLKAVADIGDGSSTVFVLTHGFGTRDLHVAIRRTSGAFDEVVADVEYTSTTTITVRFASAPTTNQYHVTILG